MAIDDPFALSAKIDELEKKIASQESRIEHLSMRLTAMATDLLTMCNSMYGVGVAPVGHAVLPTPSGNSVFHDLRELESLKAFWQSVQKDYEEAKKNGES